MKPVTPARQLARLQALIALPLAHAEPLDLQKLLTESKQKSKMGQPVAFAWFINLDAIGDNIAAFVGFNPQRLVDGRKLSDAGPGYASKIDALMAARNLYAQRFADSLVSMDGKIKSLIETPDDSPVVGKRAKRTAVAEQPAAAEKPKRAPKVAADKKKAEAKAPKPSKVKAPKAKAEKKPKVAHPNEGPGARRIIDREVRARKLAQQDATKIASPTTGDEI